MRIELEDGKYTFVLRNGQAAALRYNEAWRDLTGDKFVFAMADEITKLRKDLAEREAEILKLREALIGWFEEEISDLQLDKFAAALSTPQSSYLEQYIKDVFGEHGADDDDRAALTRCKEALG